MVPWAHPGELSGRISHFAGLTNVTNRHTWRHTDTLYWATVMKFRPSCLCQLLSPPCYATGKFKHFKSCQFDIAIVYRFCIFYSFLYVHYIQLRFDQLHA